MSAMCDDMLDQVCEQCSLESALLHKGLIRGGKENMVADTERLLLGKSRTGSYGLFHFGNFYNFSG